MHHYKATILDGPTDLVGKVLLLNTNVDFRSCKSLDFVRELQELLEINTYLDKCQTNLYQKNTYIAIFNSGLGDYVLKIKKMK